MVGEDLRFLRGEQGLVQGHARGLEIHRQLGRGDPEQAAVVLETVLTGPVHRHLLRMIQAHPQQILQAVVVFVAGQAPQDTAAARA